MENQLRRLLFGFFILMAFFTVVSRSAASVMVAKVQVDTVKDGELSYELSGTGIIKENAEKYMDLYMGFKTGKVYLEEGQQVEKGDLLFEYDIEQLKEKKNSLDKELKKLQLEYEKLDLASRSPDGSSEVEAAELAKKNAEEDLKAAEQALEDMKAKVLKDKEEAYRQAVSSYEEIAASRDEAEKQAVRAVLDAESELADLKEPQLILKEKLEAYKNAVTGKKEEDILKARRELFDLYYNGGYEEHLEEKSDAGESLKRAEEDLKDIRKKWDAAIEEEDKDSDDEGVQKAYREQLAAKKEEIKNAYRVIEDAQKKLDRLSDKDEELSSAVNHYREDMEKKSADTEASYAILYQILYDNLEVDEKKISGAGIKLDRAKEDQAQNRKQWEEKLKDASEKKEELLNVLTEMKLGSYDYEKDLKEGESGIREAERALWNAELSLSQALGNERLTKENNQVRDKSVYLDKIMFQLDMDAKQDEINNLGDIISDKGKVTAPAAGVIIKNDLVPGSILTGQEKLVIATGGYELHITAGKEEMEHFQAGDELEIEINADNEKITSRIENIELPDQDGNISFTALLPEGEYRTGGSLGYAMKKQSVTYPRCIPIQALRQDSRGTYVLLVKEKDSVLGKEETAFRLNVTVVSQDAETAAIEASLSEEDPVITGSNKNISEGDRVRIYEME